MPPVNRVWLIFSLLIIGTHVGAEPRPGRESDALLPYVENVRSLFTTVGNGKFMLLSGGEVTAARLSATDASLWTLPGQPFQGYGQIAALPDGTAFITRSRGYFFAPGLSRGDLVRITGSTPDIASVSLSGDPDPDFFSFFPIIMVMPGGVAVDAERERIYTVHTRRVIPTDPPGEFRINVYDRNLSLLGQRNHVYETAGNYADPYGIFVDAQGFVWVVGYEYPPGLGTKRLFVERHPPNLTEPPLVHWLTLGTDFNGTVVAAGDPRGGVVVASQSGFLHRVDSEGFSASFPQPGFTGGPMAVETDGSLYIGGRSGGNPALTKLTPSNTPAWSPASLTLSADRVIGALWSPAAGTIDVGGMVIIPLAMDSGFLSRYKVGAGSGGRLKEVSPLEQTAHIKSVLATPLTVEVRDAANAALGDIPVAFTLLPPPEISAELFNSEQQTIVATGRAKSDFRLGKLPLEYDARVDCPSCDESAKTVNFRVCGKLPGELYREDEDKPGKTPYIEDFIGGSTLETDRIKTQGCALTAFAMLLNIFRAQYGLTYPESTPGTLNIALTPSAFAPTAKLDFPKATRLFAGTQVKYRDSYDVGDEMTKREVLDQADRSLQLGDPVILKLKSPLGNFAHYVTAIGRCGSRYLILDPYTPTSIEFYDPDNPAFGLDLKGARTFKRGQ